MQIDQKFSERLIACMDAAGYTQETLADKMGAVSQTSVGRWRKGTVPQPRMQYLLSAVLGVSMKWLMTGKGPKEPDAEELAMQKERMALGAGMSVAEAVAEYRVPGKTSEDERLKREIKQRLDEASLSPDQISEEVLKRRVSELFETLRSQSPKKK